MFELKLNNKTIQLKWGTWAMREFCIANNIAIDKYFELLGKTQFDLDLVVKMIHIGYKSACVSSKQPIEFDENDVCDWIDEIGGLFKTDGQFIEYVKYIISNTVTTVQGNVKEEKKSLIKLSWDDILVKAAECNIRPNEFWEMTWKEFSIIVMGKERNELNEWARTRNLAYIIYLSNTAEKQPKSLRSFWHIAAIDDVEIEKEEKTMLSDEQLARTLKLYGIN